MITEIGKHRVNKGDVTNTDNIKALMGNDIADIFYSDPPWGEGNLKYWQTINNKMNGEPPLPVDLNAFINTIFFIAKNYCKGIVFVEYGVRWREFIINTGKSYGLNYVNIIPLLYRAGNKMLPLDLHIFSHTLDVYISDEYKKSVTNTHGLNTLRKAITPFAKRDKIILDPCCGMGYTAQIAIDNDMIFRGNEINQKRLGKTINRLQKCTIQR